MNSYQYPLSDAEFILKELLNFDEFCNQYDDNDINLEFVSVILSESAKLCERVIAPLNTVGDKEGADFSGGTVSLPKGFTTAYQQFVENGWTSLTGNPAYGGQGLPHIVGVACNEMLQAANLAFSLNPLLTSGAIDAIEAHAAEHLKEAYLPPMVEGRWSGTMNLTEPDAGSDLAAIKTRAEPVGDHYRIVGQKIFITWGEHDLTENIIHLVLARLPDAPAGVKGISLFLVPKFLLDDNGQLGQRNDVRCVSIEHKLGIHASPTCVMAFGEEEGAIGYLIGEPHQGLACMFTMMNAARQGVGLQGLAISDRAYQQAKAYANERVQGTSPSGSRYAIVHYADVRRLLMLQKSATEAMRAVAYEAAFQADKFKASGCADDLARLELYTPIVKAWMTELAQELTGLALQVQGGMGYIEETGAAQYIRDARILPIYEGTTAIQGNDLVVRKILLNQGVVLMELLEQIETLATICRAELVEQKQLLLEAVSSAKQCVNSILQKGQDRQFCNAVGANMALLLGYVCGASLMLKSADICLGRGDDFSRNKVISTQFYFAHWLPRVATLKHIILAGDQYLEADLS